jgi:hypothetical protein
MKCDSRILFVISCGLFAFGILHTVYDKISRWGSSIRADPGFVQANIAIVAAAFVALFAALALRKVEERLRRIEASGAKGDS